LICGVSIVNSLSEDYDGVIATLCGTIGLEYALRGNKVIVFGNAWYSFLPNVHNFISEEALFNFLQDDVFIDVEQVHSLVRNAISKYTFEFQLTRRYAKFDKKNITKYLSNYFKEKN